MHRWFAPVLMLSLVAALTAPAWSGRLLTGAGPEAVLADGFSRALDTSETSWTTTPPNISLSSLGGPTAAFGRQISVGDLVTISAKNGAPEAIRVTALEQIDGVRIGLAGVRFQLVTGRRVGKAAGGTPVRFLFAQDAPAEAGLIRVPHRPDRVL